MRIGLALSVTTDAIDSSDEIFSTSGTGAMLPTAGTGTGSIFDPSFATGAVSWWDATLSPHTLTVSKINQLNDLIGTNHVTDTSNVFVSPTLTPVGINGTPEVSFDGAFNALAKAFTLNNPMWSFVVCSVVTYGTAGVHDILLDGFTAGKMVIGSVLSGSTAMSSGSAITDASHAIPNAGTLGCFIGVYGSSATMTFLDSGGTYRTTTGNSGANNSGGITIGALGGITRNLAVKVKEVACGTGTLPSGDITALKTYARLKHLLAA